MSHAPFGLQYGCSKWGREAYPGPLFLSAKYRLLQDFSKWACLDSNQGPLPYQRSKSISDASYPIRELDLHKAETAFLASKVSGHVRLRSGQVAARLLHIPKSSGGRVGRHKHRGRREAV